MAGFVGVCSSSPSRLQETVANALEATVYSSKTVTRKVISDNSLILGKSFFNFLEMTRTEAEKENTYVWIDGEIYNQPELSDIRGEVFADTLLRAYRSNSLERLLSIVNGIYIALIYDKDKNLFHFITDRYGLKPFYFYQRNNCLIFAPELKCFPHFKSFTLQVRKDVISCFMQLEHFLGNDTWFEGVETAAPSTIYTYALLENKLNARRYWFWSGIKKATLTIDEAAEEMGRLLDAAIKSRFASESRVGVALSGGLDSRALVAAVHEQNPVTYTFGTTNSKDVQIAKKVAEIAGLRHFHYDTYSEHWLASRFSGVWKTDGMLNMLHMHYSHLMQELPKIMDINLSGFLGDAVLGGTYLEKKGKIFLNQRMNSSIAKHYYGVHYERCNPADPFFDLDKIDPYLFYNRGRRMIGMGAEEPYKTVPQRLPFMDTELMDLSYSLPDEYRAHSKVYNKALLLMYKKFYVNIPHATTGVPISNNPSLLHVALKKYNRLEWIVKYKLGMQTSFVNVQNWIKQDQESALISGILNPKNAIYPSYTSYNFYDEFLIPHLKGRHNFVRQVMGALTLEIWFQQILNKKYLPPDVNTAL